MTFSPGIVAGRDRKDPVCGSVATGTVERQNENGCNQDKTPAVVLTPKKECKYEGRNV